MMPSEMVSILSRIRGIAIKSEAMKLEAMSLTVDVMAYMEKVQRLAQSPESDEMLRGLTQLKEKLVELAMLPPVEVLHDTSSR